MSWPLVFGVVYVIVGATLAVFAKPIAVWDYGYDLKWKILLMFGIKSRIWFLRIGGTIIMLLGLFVSRAYLLPQ